MMMFYFIISYIHAKNLNSKFYRFLMKILLIQIDRLFVIDQLNFKTFLDRLIIGSKKYKIQLYYKIQKFQIIFFLQKSSFYFFESVSIFNFYSKICLNLLITLVPGKIDDDIGGVVNGCSICHEKGLFESIPIKIGHNEYELVTLG